MFAQDRDTAADAVLAAVALPPSVNATPSLPLPVATEPAAKMLAGLACEAPHMADAVICAVTR
jgi:hypothetical protein